MKKIEDKTIKNIFKNVIKATLIIFYYFVLSILFLKLENEILQDCLKLLTIAILIIVIYKLEKSYKNDDGYMFLEASEYIAILLHSLSITYIINKYKFDFRQYVIASSYVFAIYFILKAIIIYTKGEREYAKSLSDIPEIVKKEEPKIKEATKKNEISLEDEIDNVKEKQKSKKSTTKKATTKTTTKKNIKEKDIKTKEKTKKEESNKEDKKTSDKKASKNKIDKNEDISKKENNKKVNKKSEKPKENETKKTGAKLKKNSTKTVSKTKKEEVKEND